MGAGPQPREGWWACNLFPGDEKVVALVCDNQLFVKITPPGRALVGERYVEGTACPGAKPSMLIGVEEIDDNERLRELIRLTADALPKPKPKKPRVTKKGRRHLTRLGRYIARVPMPQKDVRLTEAGAGRQRSRRKLARRAGYTSLSMTAMFETLSHLSCPGAR